MPAWAPHQDATTNAAPLQALALEKNLSPQQLASEEFTQVRGGSDAVVVRD
jgi:hypothetical protein